MKEIATLKKIEQSKLAIREVKSLDEIKQVLDQGEALKAYARSAQMSAEIQADIAELNMRAARRLGEISRNLEKAKGGHPYQNKSTLPSSGRVETKTQTLLSAGIDIRRANEAEKIAKIPEKDFETRITEAKAAAEKITQSLFTEKEVKREENSMAFQRVRKYRRTGIKPDGWRDSDNDLAKEFDARDARLEAYWKELARKNEATVGCDKDPFIKTVQDYLDGIQDNDRKLAICKNIMTVCRKILADSQKTNG